MEPTINQNQQPRPWWKDNWSILALAALAVVIATITGLGCGLRWAWTGLATKSAWDWLELLIIPIALGAGAFWFNNQARKSEQAIAQDRVQEEALQRYLDRMQELLLDKDKGLRRPEKDTEVRVVARARTPAVLRSLDGKRKGES